MLVMVTGGTGVVGQATVTALVAAGHRVRLLSRHAKDDASGWPSGVEGHTGDVGDESTLAGAADGCDVVLHLAAVVRESPPEVTFERVNVEGTRHVVAEANRAGVRRFIYVSSLGAERGASEYHRTKFAGEELARRWPREWIVMRAGNVYGPGDEIISLLLRMIRTLPAIPVIDGGAHEFQPMWVGDLAQALVGAVERDDVTMRTFELAGPDRTSMNDLIDRLTAITDRSVLRIPMPGFLAQWGAELGEKLGFTTPINAGQIQMLEEGSLIDDPADNALDRVFGVQLTPLAAGLRQLADALPEQLPEDGVGSLKRRHVWADIEGSAMDAEALFARFCARFSEITPWHMHVGAEPGTPTELREGGTLTMHLPVRGNIQVRIEEATARGLTLVTLEGHPLAGAVNFRCQPVAGGASGRLRFEARVYDRASNAADWLMMTAVGSALQRATWKSIIEAVVAESGGRAPDGVQHEADTLRGDGAAPLDRWLRTLVAARKREARAEQVASGVNARAADQASASGA